MSWAQLSNRPNNVSPYYNHNHSRNNTYYRKPNNHKAQPNHSNDHYNPAPQPYHHQNQTQNRNYNTTPPKPNYQIRTQNQNQAGNKVSTTNSKRKHSDINYVILDSGAFIGRQSFYNNFSPNVTYYMTPAVNHEIRDKQSRQFLDNFPYQIIVKKPDPQSIQFVSKFLNKNPNLRSLSKVDRQIIALAHTLELSENGTKNLSEINKHSTNHKALSVTHPTQKGKKQIKKSKTGRVHTQAKPMSDTGVRLSKLKKVIPFEFDDFMTMTKDEYGNKYGTPTPTEMHTSVSPKHPKLIQTLSEIKENMSENKDNSDHKNVKYNPALKAKTECNDTSETNACAMSKSQRRRLRKKALRAAENKSMTAENVLSFDIINDSDEDVLDTNGIEQEISELKLKESQSQKSPKKNEGKETSDIDAMIAEDLNTTFNETASLISSLSAQSAQHKQQINDINKRLNIGKSARNDRDKVNVMPRIDQSQSHPIVLSENKGFGTLFDGAKGSIFKDKNVRNAVENKVKLAPLEQNTAVEQKNATATVSKKTTTDAWNGEWLTPENFKTQSKNAKKNAKKKLKNVENVSNEHSSVACITVDKAMQKAMIEMGLRVLTSDKNRQYGNTKGKGNINGEPIDYMFRCYGCFQYENNTNRTHCRWCGGQTYQRVAVYEDDQGKHHYRYYYRDRYGHKYLDKHSLVPRGQQLVRNNQMNGQNQSDNYRGNRNQKKKKKKRPYLGNNHNYRGGGNRW